MPRKGSLKEDYTGRRFARLKVVGLSPKKYGANNLWLCRCKCGNETAATARDLRRGKVKSCGCLRKERIAKFAKDNASRGRATKHPYFFVWAGMIRRCYNPKEPSFANYGARGITVCKQWRDDPWQFFKDMGKRPKGHSIHRKDNDKGYTPDNCCWADRTVQSRVRRGRKMLAAFGETKCQSEWAEQFGANDGAVALRLDRGWTIEDALTKPFIGKRKMVTAFGKTQSVKDWADETGMSASCLLWRINDGWDAERALTQPSQKRKTRT